MSKVQGYFSVWPTVQHSSGYTFQQRGGRVFITDAEGSEVDTITDNELQSSTSMSPVVLTPTKLQRLANTWLADNMEGR